MECYYGELAALCVGTTYLFILGVWLFEEELNRMIDRFFSWF